MLSCCPHSISRLATAVLTATLHLRLGTEVVLTDACLSRAKPAPTKSQAGGWIPHCVGTSSFSMSGVNAHVVHARSDASRAAVPPANISWRRKALGVPVPIPSGHPLLYAAKVTEVRGTAAFSMRLDSACLAFLGDHRVQSEVLMPGTAMCEAASAAAGMLVLSSHRRTAIFAAVFAAPLPLPLPPPSADADDHAVALLEMECHEGKLQLLSAGVQVLVNKPAW